MPLNPIERNYGLEFGTITNFVYMLWKNKIDIADNYYSNLNIYFLKALNFSSWIDSFVRIFFTIYSYENSKLRFKYVFSCRQSNGIESQFWQKTTLLNKFYQFIEQNSQVYWAKLTVLLNKVHVFIEFFFHFIECFTTFIERITLDNLYLNFKYTFFNLNVQTKVSVIWG